MTDFPPLPYDDWVGTRDTIHLFTQMVGKVRMAAHPKLNHWWHVTLYPSVSGLTTGRVPHGGVGSFEIAMDFRDHRVTVTRRDGASRSFGMAGLSVAGFHDALFGALAELGIAVDILGVPYENKSTVPFAENDAPRPYDREMASRWWQAIGAVANVQERWRGGFAGKQTPVQLFWHSFDLVVTRFSGRRHQMEGGTASDREAYSHEVVSTGFWPGDAATPMAGFYAYAWPDPGLAGTALPEGADWVDQNGSALAVLPYEAVRTAADPEKLLLAFMEQIYRTTGELADWPMADLEHRFADGA